MRKKVLITMMIAVCILSGNGMVYYQHNDKNRQTEQSSETEEMLNQDIVETKDSEYYAYIDEKNPKTVQIGNKKTGKEFSIQINDKEERVNAVVELEWISDVELGILSHIDPSVSYFCVYNAKQKTFFDEKYGVHFQWVKNDESTLIYAVASPHFSKEKGYEVVKNQKDEILYTTEQDEEIAELALSPNGEEIAMLLWNRKTDSNELVMMKRNGTDIQRKTIGEYPDKFYWQSDAVLVVGKEYY